MWKRLSASLIVFAFALLTVAQASDKIPEVYPSYKIEPPKKEFPTPDIGTRVDKPPVVKPFSRIYVYDPYEVFFKQPKWSKNIGNRTIESSWGVYRFLDNGTVYYTFHEPLGVWHNLSITYMLEPLTYTGNVSYVFQNDTQVIYKVYLEKAVLTVTWVFTGKEPKTTVQVETEIKGYRVYAVVTSYTGVYLDGDGEKSLITFTAGTSAEERYSVVDEGTAYFVKVSERTVKAYFKHNKNFIDPYLYVVAPSTVTVDWSTTGEKILLQVTDNLPAGSKVVVFGVGWEPVSTPIKQGFLRVKKGDTILAEQGITFELNYAGIMYPIMIFAVDGSANGRDTYTLVVNVVSSASATNGLHVQGMVFLVREYYYASNLVSSIAAGAVVDVVSISTSFPANSKIVVLATGEFGVTSTSSADRLYNADSIRIVENSSIVSSNQFSIGTYRATIPAHVSLIYYNPSSQANPTYKLQFYNNLSETSRAWGQIVAFPVTDGAFLDTGSVALTSESQVTVGNLLTYLFGDVGVIALAAAENTTSSNLTVFYENDIVLQIDNNASTQITNQRGWFLTGTTRYSRSGVYPLFRADTNVFNPSYQVKMTARLARINGEVKIVAFTLQRSLTNMYIVYPTTVTVDWSTTGDKTLLTITDDLGAGNKIVLFTVGWDGSANICARGVLKIVSNGVLLVREGISHVLNGCGMQAYPVTLFAYHSGAPANAVYSFVVEAGAISDSSTVHVQGMVMWLGSTEAFYASGIRTSIAPNTVATVVTVNTNYSAGSKLAVLAYTIMGIPSSMGCGAIWVIRAGNIRILRGTTIVSVNQYDMAICDVGYPALASLSYFDSSSVANPSYSVQVYNSVDQYTNAWSQIIVFPVRDGAFIDTNSVALSQDVETTVGNLSTTLSGEVAVIALIASAVGPNAVAFNPGDIKLQLNNSAAGQVTNQRGWYLGNQYGYNRAGIFALFRVDENVSNPSYQVKMTARVEGMSGETKILAFMFWFHTVTARYSVASGGNAVQGSILLRYYRGGTIRQIALSTSDQTFRVDPNSVINVDFISSGSTSDERWAYSGGDNFTMTVTADISLNLLYYNQIRVTLDARTSKPYTSTLSPSNHARVNTTYFGEVFTWKTWDGALNNTWVDRGGNVRWYQTSSSSTSTHRWATPGSVTLENIQAPSTSLAWFYEQWYVTWSVQAAVNSTTTSSNNNFTAYGKQFNGSLSLSPLYQGSPKSDWVDHSSTLYTSTLSSGSTNIRRWVIRDSYTATSSGTYIFTAVEEYLANVSVFDGDGINPVTRVTTITIKNYNGTNTNVPTTKAWFQANVRHSILSVIWNGYEIKNDTLQTIPNAYFYVTTPNSTVQYNHPRIWADLGGSGTEIWLRSKSTVFSVIWDSLRKVLYIQSDKARGEAYYWYGPLNTPPKYVYVDGTLFSDTGYTVDPNKQVVKLTVGGGSFLFDHEGKTQAPQQQDITFLLQQLYAVISGLRPGINITQPAGPTIRISFPNLQWLIDFVMGIYSMMPAGMRTVVQIALPFLLIVSLMALVSRSAKSRKVKEGETVVIVRESRKQYTVKAFLSTLLSSAMFVVLAFYVLPLVMPNVFKTPNADFRTVLMASIGAAAISFIAVYLVLGSRKERGHRK